MAPSWAEASSVVARATPIEVVVRGLSESQGILFTHLVVWLLTLVTGLFLGLRFFAKWYRKVILRVDDGLLIAAWVIIVIYSTTTSLELALGLGSTQTSISTAITTTGEGPSSLLLLDNLARTYALAAAAWSKSAFACTLLGINDRRGIRWGIWVMVVLLNMDVLGTVVAHWVRCKPIYKAWIPGADGKCWSRSIDTAIQISAQAYLAFSDLTLIALGFLLVWSKNLRLGEKVGLGLLGMLGVIAAAGAIVTAVELSVLNDDNWTTNNIRVLLSASVDPALTILAASIPTLLLLTPTYKSRISSPHSNIRIIRNINDPKTPASPPLGARAPPSRPLRPMSSRSFMTTADGPASGSKAGSSDNLLQGVDYNYSHWNPSIPPPPTTTTTTTTRPPGSPPSPSSTLTNNNNNNFHNFHNNTAAINVNNNYNSNYTNTQIQQQQQQQQQHQQQHHHQPQQQLQNNMNNINTTTYSTYSPYGNNPAAPNGDGTRRLTTLEEEERSVPSYPSYTSTVRSSRGFSVGNLMRHVEGMMPNSHKGPSPPSPPQQQQQQQHPARTRDSPTLGLEGPYGGGGGGRGNMLLGRSSSGAGQKLDVADDYFSRGNDNNNIPSKPPATGQTWSQRMFGGYL